MSTLIAWDVSELVKHFIQLQVIYIYMCVWSNNYRQLVCQREFLGFVSINHSSIKSFQ